MKTKLQSIGLAVALVILGSGCATWDGLSPGAQNALRAAAKVALSFGVNELADRVKEVRPYADKLKGVLDVTFAQPGSAASVGARLNEAVRATVPPELHAPVLDEFKRKLAGAPASGGKPSAQDKFNAAVAAKL